MRVIVQSIEPQGTIAIGRGIDQQGRIVTFSGDWRPMRDIAIAIGLASEGDEDVIADVPEWAVLSVQGDAS